MQIESLKVYCDLIETESFTKTAQINGVTQSAVSQTMSVLERQFQALLVERSKKSFRITPEGEIVYRESKRILHEYSTLHTRIEAMKNVVSGNIRIATVYSIGLHEMPPYIKRFMKEYPEVNIHLEYRRPNQVYEDVLGNVADLGLLAFPGRNPKLEIVPLRKEPLMLVCSPQNPLAKSKSIKLKALSGQKFISFERDMPARKAIDKIFKAHGVVAQHVMEFDNIETLKRAVEIDSGIALLPQTSVKQEVSNHTLSTVPLEGSFFWHLGLIHKKARALSPALKLLIAQLEKPL